MKIDKLEVGFTSLVDIGRCAYFIFTNTYGAYTDVDEIFENCRGFSRVVVLGDEPLLQKEEVAKLCKKLVKTNPRVKIELHTNGLIRPIEVSGYANNTVFNVFVKMKYEPDYKINEQMLIWYNEVGANFIFKVRDQKDLEDVGFVCNSIGIKKAQVFLCPVETIPELTRLAKFYGYNLSPYVEWEYSE